MNKLYLHNSLTRKKEEFVPLDESNIHMYVCGPTVYDSPHIGNARAVVVYDVLYRLLRHLYKKVNYVRNITDVDDKIIKAAAENGESIADLTMRITDGFHEDMRALGNLDPTHEPKATEHIPQMIKMIEKLIKNGNAYESDGHVLFSVKSAESYGQLSGKKLEDLIAGARVDVEDYKADSGDFILWKPANEGDDPSCAFDSPWGKGRPGWHIECSAMSNEYLGSDFDIHGGGADLKFPHHENEIAQSTCANPDSHFARYWVHNGFVTVNGTKMAKSEGNFITVHELLNHEIRGEEIRYALLSAKYNEPLDWTGNRLAEAIHSLNKFYSVIEEDDSNEEIPEEFMKALCDDLNTPKAFSILHSIRSGGTLKACGKFLGMLQEDPQKWLYEVSNQLEIEQKIAARDEAKASGNFEEADRIRAELKEQGIILEDHKDRPTTWRKA